MELIVTAEITAVEFRPLNSFEWAVLNILTIFPETPPSLVEAATRLGIGEPAFLQAALNMLVSIEAVVCRTDEVERHDLNDFVLTEFGGTILKEDGWERGDELKLTEEFSMEWPAAKIRLGKGKRQPRENHPKQSGPTSDEVEARLLPEQIDEMLNSNNSQIWRTRSFYVTSVEM